MPDHHLMKCLRNTLVCLYMQNPGLCTPLYLSLDFTAHCKLTESLNFCTEYAKDCRKAMLNLYVYGIMVLECAATEGACLNHWCMNLYSMEVKSDLEIIYVIFNHNFNFTSIFALISFMVNVIIYAYEHLVKIVLALVVVYLCFAAVCSAVLSRIPVYVCLLHKAYVYPLFMCVF